MSLRDEMALYTELSGNDGNHTPIGIIGAYLDGYEKGKVSAQPEIIRCKDCVYYDPPHINDHGERREYKDMPAEAFDELGTGLVNMSYGINVGGRCLRDYNAGYSDDKRIFVPETNYCGRAERMVEHEKNP